MGQMCSFGDVQALNATCMTASWEICLNYLSRCQEMSSISQKALRLLKESAGRLIFPKKCHLVVRIEIKNQVFIFAKSMQDFQAKSQTINAQLSSVHSNGNLNSFDNSIITPSVIDTTRQGFVADINYDLFNSDPWNVDFTAVPYFPFMPYLSQLETFPPQ